MDSADYAKLSSDRRVNDLALWLAPEADTQAVQQALRELADQGAAPGAGAGDLLEFGSAAEIRATTLKIFDRSFAVTYWLQAVAVGIGLFGVAASFSAQVLARRKEFGLLAHLGLTRRQILRVVAAEGAAWTTLGAIAGVGLGLAVAVASDAVASRRLGSMALALARLSAAAVTVVNTEMALFEWLHQAGTPEFKELSKLIK